MTGFVFLLLVVAFLAGVILQDRFALVGRARTEEGHLISELLQMWHGLHQRVTETEEQLKVKAEDAIVADVDAVLTRADAAVVDAKELAEHAAAKV